MIDTTILNVGSDNAEEVVSASVISLSDLRRGSDHTRPEQIEMRTNFDIAVRCVIANAYILASPLIDPTADSVLRGIDHLVDDPLLLSAIAAHSARLKLCQLLLSSVIAESARCSLWQELEVLLATKTTSTNTR